MNRSVRAITSSSIRWNLAKKCWGLDLNSQLSRTSLFFARPFSNIGSINEGTGGPYQRNRSIIMNPDGTGSHILPGGFVNRDGRRVVLEKAYGYFWMLKDLEKTTNKPIVSHQSLIPLDHAQRFPPLTGVKAINGEQVSIPEYFMRHTNKNESAEACTLVTISFKDFGFKMLPSWIDPFKEAFFSNKTESNETNLLPPSPSNSRIQMYSLNIIEGGLIYKLLSPIITRQFKANTPEQDHDSTLMYFGEHVDFRDSLRMHNTLTGYVLLLDGLGRVRWMGSGNATDEEIKSLIECTKELTQTDTKRGKVVPRGKQAVRRNLKQNKARS